MFQERISKRFDGNTIKTVSIFQIMIKMCGKNFDEICFNKGLSSLILE